MIPTAMLSLACPHAANRRRGAGHPQTPVAPLHCTAFAVMLLPRTPTCHLVPECSPGCPITPSIHSAWALAFHRHTHTQTHTHARTHTIHSICKPHHWFSGKVVAVLRDGPDSPVHAGCGFQCSIACGFHNRGPAPRSEPRQGSGTTLPTPPALTRPRTDHFNNISIPVSLRWSSTGHTQRRL